MNFSYRYTCTFMCMHKIIFYSIGFVNRRIETTLSWSHAYPWHQGVGSAPPKLQKLSIKERWSFIAKLVIRRDMKKKNPRYIPFLFHVMETTLFIECSRANIGDTALGCGQVTSSGGSTTFYRWWVPLMWGPFALPMMSVNIQIWASIMGNVEVPLCVLVRRETWDLEWNSGGKKDKVDSQPLWGVRGLKQK